MKVRDLIEILESYDGDMKVIIGMVQDYGSNFAMDITYDVEERKVKSFYGKDFKAIVITEGDQIGVVNYDDDDDEEEEDEE